MNLRSLARILDSRRYAFRYRGHLARCRRKLAGGSRLRVLFLVNDNTKWNADSVYKLLRDDERFDCSIVVCRQEQSELEKRTRLGYNDDLRFFAEREVPVVPGVDPATGADIDVLSLKPDLVFYCQPWGWVAGRNNLEHVSRGALTAAFPYSVPVANDPSDWGAAFYFRLWRYCLPDVLTLEDFSGRMVNGAANCRVTGYPKLDEYMEPAAASGSAGGFRAESPSTKPTIIWAPHHSFAGRLRYATFEWSAPAIAGLCSERAGVEWVCKPHPRLRFELVKQGLFSEEGLREWFDAWCAMPNARVYDAGGYMGLFRESAALLTDSVSFLAEYLPSGSPVVLLVNEKSAGYNRLGSRIVEAYYKAHNAGELQNIVAMLLRGEDPLREKRLAARELLIDSSASAAFRTRKLLLEEFGELAAN